MARTSAALNVTSPDQVDETAAAIVKVLKSTGIKSTEVAADKILSAGSMSQVIDPAKLFRNLPGAMQSGPPGPQSMWLGLQLMHIMANCWLTFGPESEKRCV